MNISTKLSRVFHDKI